MKTHHGYDIVASVALTRDTPGVKDTDAIVADRGPETFQRYAVWTMHTETGHTHSGHYTDSLEHALEVMYRRAGGVLA